MKKHATALRAITHADESHTKGAVLLGMDGGQFADWRDAGLVREATEKEVADAKGTPAAKPKPARKAKARPVPSASVTADPVPPAEPAADA